MGEEACARGYNNILTKTQLFKTPIFLRFCETKKKKNTFLALTSLIDGHYANGSEQRCLHSLVRFGKSCRLKVSVSELYDKDELSCRSRNVERSLP